MCRRVAVTLAVKLQAEREGLITTVWRLDRRSEVSFTPFAGFQTGSDSGSLPLKRPAGGEEEVDRKEKQHIVRAKAVTSSQENIAII